MPLQMVTMILAIVLEVYSRKGRKIEKREEAHSCMPWRQYDTGTGQLQFREPSGSMYE